jgi:N,N'-diacetylchitobiose phosphorylase
MTAVWRGRRLPRLDSLSDRFPHSRVLSNGSYTVLLTGAGSGFSRRGTAALTGWNADRTEDGFGFFVYLRDLDDGAFWSAGHQPAGVATSSYAVGSAPGAVTIARRDREIESQLRVCVDAARDREVRRLLLRNASGRPRAIEVTSYAEVVLQPIEAHWSHPAFSKLFVQTELAEEEVLLASRRPRSADERRTWLAHALWGEGPLEHETDRVRFIGRGRTLAAPSAMTSSGPLGATVGNVLDPIFALRRSVRLEPGASAVFDVVLAVADRRDDAIALGRDARGDVQRIFEAGEERELGLRRRLKLHGRSAEAVQEQAGAALYGASSPAWSDAERAYASALGLSTPSSEPAPAAVSAAATRVSTRRTYEPVAHEPLAHGEELSLANGYGGFAADGAEYVIVGSPPMPWINVVANEQFGFLASESGAGYTWNANSRENRLTPWSNDPVIDPHGEALYVRDERRRRYWPAMPGPAAGAAPCETRHGIGYSRWRHTTDGLEHDVLAFVPRSDPVKITRLTIRNSAARPRRLSLISYAHLVLGVLPAQTAASVVTEIDAEREMILARNEKRGEFSAGVTFAALVKPAGSGAVSMTCDRVSFLGRNRSSAAPLAVVHGAALDGRAGAGLDPCAALQLSIETPAGGDVECAVLLGEARDGAHARELVDRYRAEGAIEAALSEVREFWRETLTTVEVATPSPAIDRMVDGWLLYQCLGCRIWGRSAFYQSGGAFGFRDQLQDSAALLLSRPDLTRAQILLHAGHQFVEGDVLHWWHPPADHGTRTRCSDDLLWLPYVTSDYIGATGDWSVLDERAGFLTAPPLEPGEDDAYLQPSPSGESADVYEHCCRAIDRSLTVGRHGLPLIGTCDWNDGMNRVGREGKGESVWLAFFLFTVLGDFAPICERRGDRERARRYREHAAKLRQAIEDEAWDGAWYRRAYYDDGTPLGSAANAECRIDALAQAWAVISGAAAPERARQAMDEAERQLVSESDGIIRLLTPPFDRAPQDPGYIKGYVPGIRENGGQYTHGAVWVVCALARLRRRDRAARLLEMLTPIHHARDRAAAEVYKVEPYVVVADVYGTPPHVGRGGWTWYTGSAGWLYRIALEAILGIRLEAGNRLRVLPCIPDDWPGFTVRYRLPRSKTRYEIVVENPERRAESVRSATLDDEAVEVADGVATVALRDDGGAHRVRVVLGGAV